MDNIGKASDATRVATWDATLDATDAATWDAAVAATWAATGDATLDATRGATWEATDAATGDATIAALRFVNLGVLLVCAITLVGCGKSTVTAPTTVETGIVIQVPPVVISDYVKRCGVTGRCDGSVHEQEPGGGRGTPVPPAVPHAGGDQPLPVPPQVPPVDDPLPPSPPPVNLPCGRPHVIGSIHLHGEDAIRLDGCREPKDDDHGDRRGGDRGRDRDGQGRTPGGADEDNGAKYRGQ